MSAGGIEAQLERRRRLAAERWDLDEGVVLIGAGVPVPVPGRGDRTPRRADGGLPHNRLNAQHCVAMTDYAVAHFEEIDEISDGRSPFRPIRHHLGITSFGVNTWTGREPGDRIINEHDEDGEDEELYFVQSGRATFELDGDRVDAPAGTFVFARPGVKRTAYAEEPGTTIFAVGSTPGRAYEADGWEIWTPFNRLYLEGRYAEAAAGGREAVKAHPEYAGLFYNLACCESLAGETAAAIEHLRLAIEKSERSRSFAADDSDFDPIREEPAFQRLM